MPTEQLPAGLNECIDAALKIGMLQNKPELLAFCEWLRPRQITNFCEIGTYTGGSFSVWDHISHPGAHIAIDPNIQVGIIMAPEQLAQRAERFTQMKPTIHMLMMDSTRAATKQRVMDILDGQPLDFLFIDGHHSLRACHTDYAYYGQLVRPGGVIAFHDAARFPGPQQIFQIVADHAAEKRMFVGPGELRGIGAIIKE